MLTVQRRGVASVLAMMFLVLFGSLVAAMAITSRSNIRTASTHLEVMQAMSAADTGMAIAQRRLTESAERFIVANSTITPEFIDGLWKGNLDDFGAVMVAASPSSVGDNPAGLAEALVNFHMLDTNIITRDALDLSEPGILEAWPDADLTVYQADWWVITPIIALQEQVDDAPPPPAYQVVYAPLADGETIRVISIGYDFVDGRGPMTRTITRDFRMTKSIDHAIISPSRIMIGKNVQIVGDLGARYDDLDFANGDPLVTRSDFRGLDPGLDTRLDELFAILRNPALDVDGDNRLRIGHPVEGQAIPGDDINPDAYLDATGDGYVDEFDVFINFFDRAPRDNRIHIETEFVNDSGDVIDADLALLIDGSNPDRNRNGKFGFLDYNNNGLFEPDASPSETLIDWIWVPQSDGTMSRAYLDGELGYLDGYIDDMDRYVKIDGKLIFRVGQGEWASTQGNPNTRIEGAIRPQSAAESAKNFEADDEKLPLVNASSFTSAGSALLDAADGEPFWVQVQANLALAGKSVTLESLYGPTMNYIEASAVGSTYTDDEGIERPMPRYQRVDMDLNGDGQPDNWETAYYEPMPMNSPNVADWYYRPVFDGMVFRNVVIPRGLNALFRDCVFSGVTRVETHTNNSGVFEGSAGNVYASWSMYGQMEYDSTIGRPVPKRPRYLFGDDLDEYDASSGCVNCPPLDEDVLPEQARPPMAMLYMALDPLDKADIPADQVGTFNADDYARLPDPLIIRSNEWNGSAFEERLVRVHDSKMYSNNIRFHNSQVVGSIVSDTPQEYTHIRNKIQFTGSTRFMTEHPTEQAWNPDEEDLNQILRSSMMLPNFSVDVGTFNSPAEQDVKLQGAVIAGVLDMRGNAEVDGSLILTFKPTHGEGPLVDLYGSPIGNPAGFNASIGYFGPGDGDFESIDPSTLPLHEGQRIVGWDLNGDGFADLGPTETPTSAQIASGAVALPFNGYGKVRIKFNPEMQLPDGILLPMKVRPVAESYREGKL
jgi:hypothetical protein